MKLKRKGRDVLTSRSNRPNSLWSNNRLLSRPRHPRQSNTTCQTSLSWRIALPVTSTNNLWGTTLFAVDARRPSTLLSFNLMKSRLASQTSGGFALRRTLLFVPNAEASTSCAKSWSTRLTSTFNSWSTKSMKKAKKSSSKILIAMILKTQLPWWPFGSSKQMPNGDQLSVSE